MAGLNLNIDATQIDAATKKAKAGLDGVAASARTTEAALKKAGGGGDELKRKFDPAYSAALKLGNELDDLDRALKVGAIDAKVYAAEIGRMGAATGVASGRFGKMGSSLQNVGYQVGDFAVQVGAGTSAAQALGQQLPQLLQGFGLLGVGLSVVAAVGLPLGTALWNMSGGAKSLGDSTNFAAERLDAFRAAVDNAKVSGAELNSTYGAAAGAVSRAFDLVATQKAEEAQRAIDGVSASLDEMFAVSGRGGRGRTISNMFDLGVMSLASEQVKSLTADFSEQQNVLAGADGNLRLQLETLTAMYQTTQDLANVTDGVSAAEQGVIDGIGTALDLVSQQIALTGELEGAISNAGASSETMSLMLQDAATAAGSIASNAPGAGWLSGAIGDVATLANTLWGAAAAAAAAANKQRQDDKIAGAYGLYANTRLQAPKEPVVHITPGGGGGGGGRKSAGGGSGGGGGISAAEKASNAYDSLIASLDPAERSTQALAKAQETVNAALKVGAISAAEAANAMKLAGEKYTEASGSAKYWADINKDLKSSFLDMAIDGVNSFDDIAKSIKRAALEALLFKTGPLAGMFGGGAGKSGGGFGSLISGIFGGGGGFAGLFDGGGMIGMGKTGIVGENGPEAVTSKPNGTLVTSRVNTARQMQGGGGGVVMGEIKVSVDGEGSVKAYVQRMGIQAATSAVETARKSMPGWSGSYQKYGA